MMHLRARKLSRLQHCVKHHMGIKRQSSKIRKPTSLMQVWKIKIWPKVFCICTIVCGQTCFNMFSLFSGQCFRLRFLLSFVLRLGEKRKALWGVFLELMWIFIYAVYSFYDYVCIYHVWINHMLDLGVSRA